MNDGQVIALSGPQGILVPRVTVARSFLRRAKGRLFTSEFPMGEGLLLIPCNEIHMLGMKYALDIVFLDRDLSILAVRPNLAVGTLRLACAGAWATLELPVGTLDARWKAGTKLVAN